MDTNITDSQGQLLLDLARKTLEQRFGLGESPSPPEDTKLFQERAVFVTLKKDGKLRGCIGNLEPVDSLWKGIERNAINAAFNDQRFSPLQREELEQVVVDISVLTAPQPLVYNGSADLIAKLRPNVDGVILRDGARGATFLPQVWDQLPKVELFLSHLCQKAGLAKDIWLSKQLQIQTYQVQYFKEKV